MSSSKDNANEIFDLSKPILSDYERMLLENKTVPKHVDIPKTLLNRVKVVKRDLQKNLGLWLNDSVIFRIGAVIALDGINNLVMKYIHKEEELLTEMRKFMSLYKESDSQKKVEYDEFLYSKNIKSVIGDFKNNNYANAYTQKLIKMPFKLADRIRNTKWDVEQVSGPWFKENMIFRVGIEVFLEILQVIDINGIKSEQELINLIKDKYNI